MNKNLYIFTVVLIFTSIYSSFAQIAGPTTNLCPNGTRYKYEHLANDAANATASYSWESTYSVAINPRTETRSVNGVNNTYAVVEFSWTKPLPNNSDVISLYRQTASGGRVLYKTLTVNTKNLATPSFSTAPPASKPCGTPGSFSVTVNAVATATSYQWTYSGSLTGPASTTTPTATINYAAYENGSFTVRAVNNTGGCTYLGPTKTHQFSRPNPFANQEPVFGGPSSMCTNEVGTFYLGNIPTNITINWTSSSSMTLISGQGQSSTRYQANAGNGSITATLTDNACGFVKTVTKQIIVSNGVPSTPPYPTGPSSFCVGSGGSWSVAYSNPNLLVWDYDTNVFEYVSGGTSFNSLALRSRIGGTSGFISVKACNTCGCSSTITIGVGVTTNCTSTMSYSYYPNPVDNTLNVGYMEDNSTIAIGAAVNSKTDKKFKVLLVNKEGKILISQENKGNKNVSLDIRNIPNGTYFLQIDNGEEILKEQVVIKH